MSGPRDTDAAALTATSGAAVIIAYQVAAKATRQVMFLSNFAPGALPSLVIAAALFSMVLVVFASRALAAKGPAKLVPAAFGVSGILHMAEWTISFRFPAVVAVLLYLHFAALGAMLISGFWSLVNERFDPHTARERIAQIAGGATLGSLIGGGIAWAVGATRTASAMLPVLCVMHLVCGWMLRSLGRRVSSAHPPTEASSGGLRAGTRLLGKHPYLRDLALLVFIGAAGATLIEIVLMSRAATAIEPAQRLRFFALFYTAANIVNCVIQTVLTRSLLEKSGLGIAACSHPAAITLGSLGASLVPGIGSAALARGSEQVIHNSLFRSAYELFYTPLPAAEKRSAKPLIDVGCERLGDMTGAVVSRGLFFLSAGIAQPLMLGAAAIAGLVGMWVARRLDRGYVVALERSLQSRALELKLEDVTDHTTRATLVRTMAGLPSSAWPRVGDRSKAPAAPPDPLLSRISDLRSGDPVRVRRALNEDVLDPGSAAHAIALLGWDEVADDAAQALRLAGPGITGQLVDALLDRDADFAVRRRIPRVLAAFPSVRALAGLVLGLNDDRFEVRYRCGRSMSAMLNGNSALVVSPDDIVYAVTRELEVDRHLWESYRLLDGGEEDQLVGDRANRGLQHVFTLLSLILPKEPLRISFYALHTGDEMLRGTALEYLDTVLPPPVRERLWPLLEDKRPKDRAPRSRDEVLAALLESHASIQLKLQELRAKNASAGTG